MRGNKLQRDERKAKITEGQEKTKELRQGQERGTREERRVREKREESGTEEKGQSGRDRGDRHKRG